MADKTYLEYIVETLFTTGTIEVLEEEQKNRVKGLMKYLVSYLVSEEAVSNLQDTLENAQILTGQLVQINNEGYRVGNVICAGSGIVIGGSAVANFYKTQNRMAKTCYIVSGLCGGTAAVAGTYSAATSYCGLSILAASGDIFGGSFLYLGNKAHKLGNYLEGEKKLNLNLFRPRNFFRRPVSKRGMGLGYKGMGFVTPVPLDIPFETILTVGGTALTIYSYSKIMIAIYRYINKKFSPKIDHSLRVYAQARFIIDSFSELEPVKKELEHIKKVNRIYYAALRL